MAPAVPASRRPAAVAGSLHLTISFYAPPTQPDRARDGRPSGRGRKRPLVLTAAHSHGNRVGCALSERLPRNHHRGAEVPQHVAATLLSHRIRIDVAGRVEAASRQIGCSIGYPEL